MTRDQRRTHNMSNDNGSGLPNRRFLTTHYRAISSKTRRMNANGTYSNNRENGRARYRRQRLNVPRMKRRTTGHLHRVNKANLDKYLERNTRPLP